MKKVLIFVFTVFLTAVMGFAQMGSGTGTYHNHEGLEMDNNLVIPHMHLGGGYQTKISMMNPGSSSEILGTLHFYQQDGTKLTVNIEGNLVETYDVTIPNGGMRVITLGDPNIETTIGWAVFITDNQYMGSATQIGNGTRNGSGHEMMSEHVFVGITYAKYGSSGNLSTQVGSMSQRFMGGMMRGFAVQVTNDEHNITGLAIVNTSDVDVTAELILKDYDGQIVFTEDIVFTAGQQRVDILSNFLSGYENIENFVGILEIRAQDDGLAPLALVNTDGIQTAIPLVMIPDAIIDMGTGGGMS